MDPLSFLNMFDDPFAGQTPEVLDVSQGAVSTPKSGSLGTIGPNAPGIVAPQMGPYGVGSIDPMQAATPMNVGVNPIDWENGLSGMSSLMQTMGQQQSMGSPAMPSAPTGGNFMANPKGAEYRHPLEQYLASLSFSGKL